MHIHLHRRVEVERHVLLHVPCGEVEHHGIMVRLYSVPYRLIDRAPHRGVVFAVAELPHYQPAKVG